MNKLKKIIKKTFSKNNPNEFGSVYELQFIMDNINSDDPNLQKIINDVYDIDKDSIIYQSNIEYFDSVNIIIFINLIKHLTNLKLTLSGLLALKYRITSEISAYIYAYYLLDKLPKEKVIDAYNIIYYVFKYGFFSDEQINNIWNSLKIDIESNFSMYHNFGVKNNILGYLDVWLN